MSCLEVVSMKVVSMKGMFYQKSNEGQSLVEVVVAIGVMGLVLTSMVMAVTIGIKTTRVAKERVEARHLIENRLEEARRERDTDPDGFFELGSRTDPTQQVGTNPVYNLTTYYTEVVPGEQIEVEVEVTWVDGANDYTVTGSTYLSKWEIR